MGVYVVKMNGEKVRQFNNMMVARTWALKHCHGKIEIMSLADCGGLPKASSRIYPNEDMPSLVYKPFVAVR